MPRPINPAAILKALEAAKTKALKPLMRAIKAQEELRDECAKKIDRLEKIIASIDGSHKPVAGKAKTPAATKKPKAKGKGKRIRRSAEQLQKDAKGILAIVKTAGKSGATVQQIRSGYPDVGASIAAFVAKHGGVKLRREGSKKLGVYFAN